MTTPQAALVALKPCPFCGHDTPEFERMGTPRQSCIVVCGNCGARHESSDEGDRCGTSWNERAALAQAEAAQPVATVLSASDFEGRVQWSRAGHQPQLGAKLYAAPQPAEAAPRQPLTRDQIDALEAGCGHATLAWDTRVSLVRATERAHGIGGKQPADLARENAELRHLLAVRVAGALLYADDGELQDNSELPAIDFKRDTPGEIARKLTDRGLRKLTKPERVHALVNAGPYPGMSEAFDAHMGAACWTDPAYRPDAATWAAAWKAALSAAEAAPPAEFLPLLLRDLCRELGASVPDACAALRDAGLGGSSQGAAVTPAMARVLRRHFAAEAAPTADQRCDIDGLRYKLPPLVMTGHQLRQALQFVQADDSPESLDTEVCLALRPGGLDTEGEKVEAGLCIWLAEYPEEGSLLLDGKPLHDVSAVAAPKQEAAALTDEQINALHREWIAAGMSGSLAFARMVERAHGIGAAQPQQPAPEPVARVPLTYEQIVDALVDDAGLNLAYRSYEEDMKFARAIERAHGIAAPQTPATKGDGRKPCTCDGAGCGPGRACVVKAGGRLGELWRCAEGAAPQTPAPGDTEGRA